MWNGARVLQGAVGSNRLTGDKPAGVTREERDNVRDVRRRPNAAQGRERRPRRRVVPGLRLRPLGLYRSRGNTVHLGLRAGAMKTNTITWDTLPPHDPDGAHGIRFARCDSR